MLSLSKYIIPKKIIYNFLNINYLQPKMSADISNKTLRQID